MKSEPIAVIKNKPDINHIEVLGDGEVHLTWDISIGAERYIIKRSKKSDCEFKKIAELASGITSFVDNTIPAEGIYWYKITAQKSMGAEKPLSKTCEAKSVNISSLEVPKMLSIKTDGKKTISFSWEGTNEADGYIILRRHSFMKGAIKIASVEKGITSYADSKFVPGQTFYYSIQSFIDDEDNTRYSNPSNELCSACLDMPEVLKIKRKHGKKIAAFVRLTSGAEGYILLRSENENEGFKEIKRTTSISSLTLTDKGARGTKGAYYAVAAFKKCEGKDIVGPMTKPFYIKYKI